MFKLHPWVVVALCVGCGSSFEASDTTGGSGGATPGGASSGGAAHSAGNGSAGSAGDLGLGAGGPSGGGMANAGSGAGEASGGSVSGAGSAGGGPDCATLKQDYLAALEKARVCSKGSLNQCNASSTLPAVGCGCPVLVNSKSDFTTSAKSKYQTYQDARCNTGPTCEVACQAYLAVSCASQSLSTGDVFVCSGAN